MKLILLTLILTPLILRAQIEDIKLENKQVFFEKVYQMDSLQSSQIQKLLTSNISKTKDLTDFNMTNEIITAKIKNAYVDYKKYGGKWGNTSAFLNHPFFGDISIIWKDQKYRVTVTNMYFDVAGLGIMKLSDLATKKKGTELGESNILIRSLQYIDNYLSDLFKINPLNTGNW